MSRMSFLDACLEYCYTDFEVMSYRRKIKPKDFSNLDIFMLTNVEIHEILQSYIIKVGPFNYYGFDYQLNDKLENCIPSFTQITNKITDEQKKEFGDFSTIISDFIITNLITEYNEEDKKREIYIEFNFNCENIHFAEKLQFYSEQHALSDKQIEQLNIIFIDLYKKTVEENIHNMLITNTKLLHQTGNIYNCSLIRRLYLLKLISQNSKY